MGKRKNIRKMIKIEFTEEFKKNHHLYSDDRVKYYAVDEEDYLQAVKVNYKYAFMYYFIDENYNNIGLSFAFLNEIKVNSPYEIIEVIN